VLSLWIKYYKNNDMGGGELSMENEAATQDGVGTAQVLFDLADTLAREERILDSVTVRRATDQWFIAKVYYVGEDQYEAVHLRYDSPQS
jgi:hypothetical protein